MVEVWKGVAKPLGVLAIAATAFAGFLHYIGIGRNTVDEEEEEAEHEAEDRGGSGHEYARAPRDHPLPRADAHQPLDRGDLLRAAALSGLALFHPALFPLTQLFGGGPWTRILHPFIGMAMVVGFALLARLWRDNCTARRPRVAARHARCAAQRGRKLPPVGKYNAGQKLLFWAIIGCLSALLLTGFVIWRRTSATSSRSG
jgi:hypothetical protein